MTKIATILLASAIAGAAQATPVSILFVGNSYTFGRTPLNPDGTLNTANNVLTYNSANVRDLTKPQGPTPVAINGTSGSAPKFTNVFGTNSYPIPMIIPGSITATNPTGTQGNSYSPHPYSAGQTNGWGGMPGIFKQLTFQAGLDYDVAMSTRNAASLRGHLLNTSNDNWDLRSNISSQKWDKVVLQEQSDEALPPQTVGGVALGSNFPSVRAYVDLIEDWVHKGRVTVGKALGTAAVPNPEVTSYTERDMFRAQFRPPSSQTVGLTEAQINALADVACANAGGGTFCTNTTTRNLGSNVTNANPNAEVYLQQTWARPDLINSPGTKTLDPKTASATYDKTKPVPSYFSSIEAMTNALVIGMQNVADFADDDEIPCPPGTPCNKGIKGIIPSGQAFLTAIKNGFATENMYAGNALTDNLIDLWFNDGTHPSVAGSYLSALTTFGSVTGLDPAMFGGNELAASDLGLSKYEAYILQEVASYQLGFRSNIPEPGSLALVALALLGVAGVKRRAAPAKVARA